MEASPLTKAHDHAREASIATHACDTTVAVSEHTLAAGEFATAAQTTASTEALRTLQLLERHHERLSQLLQISLEHPGQQQDGLEDGSAVDTKDDATVTTTISEAISGGNTGAVAGATGTGPGASAGSAAVTTSSVTGVVSRGEFANASSPTRLEGQQAGGLGLELPRTPSGAGSPAASSMSAAAAAVATTPQQAAGAAAMANVLASTSSPSQQRRYPHARELSSSIANNLASARGIRGRHHRGQPAAPSMSTEQAPGNLEGQVHKDGSRSHMKNVLQQTPDGKPSWVPPKYSVQTTEKEEEGEDDIESSGTAGTAAAADDGFSRFYSRFGSIINRLSAPLAFAGLPLITEETSSTTDDMDQASDSGQPAQKNAAAASTHATLTAIQKQQQQRRRARRAMMQASGAEPELSKIYSKAALRAIGRDGHSAIDSFYVVPKTGHTASYANILSFDQKERRRLAASVHVGGEGNGGGDEDDDDLLDRGDEDDFVDAKESQQGGGIGLSSAASLLPAFSRRMSGSPAGSGSSTGGGGQRRARSSGSREEQHIVEELYIENQSLKDMLDKLSRRLHAFEANAQHSHMALQESMRLMRPGSPSLMASIVGGGGSIMPMSLRPAAPPVDASSAASAVAASSLATDDSLVKKTDELERELARVKRQLEVSEKERTHQEKTLQRYREKWEKLKADAKARKGAQSGQAEGSSK